MDLTLAINTASQNNAVALFTEQVILAEKEWPCENNSSLELLPNITALFEDSGRTWEDLTNLLVVKGPGRYTSLRIGIAVANSMAWALKRPMIGMSQFELWEERIPESARASDYQIGLAVGRERFITPDNPSPQLWEERAPFEGAWYGEVPGANEGILLRSFGEATQNWIKNKKCIDKMIRPNYNCPPSVNEGV